MPKGDQRLLRTYYSVARTHHRCDFCMSEIVEEQEYEAQVWVMNGHFFVLKRHSDPGCPEDDWWNHDRVSEDAEEEQELDQAA